MQHGRNTEALWPSLCHQDAPGTRKAGLLLRSYRTQPNKIEIGISVNSDVCYPPSNKQEDLPIFTLNPVHLGLIGPQVAVIIQMKRHCAAPGTERFQGNL